MEGSRQPENPEMSRNGVGFCDLCAERTGARWRMYCGRCYPIHKEEMKTLGLRTCNEVMKMLGGRSR